MPGVEIRTKHKPAASSHLKSYQIDRRLLRTGAANFSASGLKRQDNDLILIEGAEASQPRAGLLAAPTPLAINWTSPAHHAGDAVKPSPANRPGRLLATVQLAFRDLFRHK
jgi:phosphatidylserine/phosphatidylglycerophosphate/cardiolipin synthase-like enzyme